MVTAMAILVGLSVLVLGKDALRAYRGMSCARLSRDAKRALGAHVAFAFVLPAAFVLMGRLGIISGGMVLPASLVAVWIALVESIIHLLSQIPTRDA